MLLPITSTIAAALAILMFPLTLRVSMRRVAVGKAMGEMNKAVFGDQGDEVLRNFIRALGNFIEYVPMCLVLLALMEVQGAPSTLLWWVGGLFAVGRYIHAVAMSTNPYFPLPRGIAMLMTYSALLIPAGWLLMHNWS